MDTPLEVQQAVDSGKLTLYSAAKVADLSLECQEVIAAGIRDGGGGKQIVAKYVDSGAPQKKRGSDVLDRLLGSLERADQRELEDELNELESDSRDLALKRLGKSKAFIDSLITRIQGDSPANGSKRRIAKKSTAKDRVLEQTSGAA